MWRRWERYRVSMRWGVLSLPVLGLSVFLQRFLHDLCLSASLSLCLSLCLSHTQSPSPSPSVRSRYVCDNFVCACVRLCVCARAFLRISETAIHRVSFTFALFPAFSRSSHSLTHKAHTHIRRHCPLTHPFLTHQTLTH
jgi:hypothetical protein